ncbi:MAG TPA: hypothetical protein DCP91_01990 [Eggerthellaceae bacterium]|nr:hypothetical protein [Eggerthellaceae bacterium]
MPLPAANRAFRAISCIFALPLHQIARNARFFTSRVGVFPGRIFQELPQTAHNVKSDAAAERNCIRLHEMRGFG